MPGVLPSGPPSVIRPFLLIVAATSASLGGCRISHFERGAWLDALLASAGDSSVDDTTPALRRGDWVRATPEETAEDGFHWRFVTRAPAPTEQESVADVDPGTKPAPTPTGPDSPTNDVPLWPPPEVETVHTRKATGLDDPVRLGMAAEDDDGIAGWNATILLARVAPDLVDDRDLERLRRLAIEPPRYDPVSREAIAGPAWFDRKKDATKPVGVAISERMQSAAAEAYARVLATSEADPVDGLAPIGVLLERRNLPPHIRAEFYRTAARWVEPSLLPFIDAAIGDTVAGTPVVVRIGAMEACEVHARLHPNADTAAWPVRIDDARWDAESDDVRIAYGRWAALTGRPSALPTLREQLFDSSLAVRTEAITSFGLLRTDAARSELRELAKDENATVRANAVAALAAWGANEVAPFVEDESFQVRRSLATALGAKGADARAARLLADLVADRDPSVQMAAVEAVDEWPIELAGPVRLTAMEESDATTREAAHRAILDILPGERWYRPRDTPERRSEAVDQIARSLGIGRHLPAAGFTETETPTPTSEPAEDRRRELDTRLAELVSAAPPVARPDRLDLGTLQPEEVRYVERHLVTADEATRERGLRALLAPMSTLHAALEDLSSTDVRRRQRAGAVLRDADARELSPFVLDRLRVRMVGERNRIVWSCVHTAIKDDGGEPAARIIRLALESEWPDLRQLGCDYIAEHPRPHRAEWVMPLFEEHDPVLLSHAIRAAGRCGHPAVVEGLPTDGGRSRTAGLQDLIGHANGSVRLAAATALAELNHPLGLGELTRLSRSTDPEQRREAYAAMGETGRLTFVEPLLRAARAEQDSRLLRIALGSLERLVDEHDRPQLPPVNRAPDAALRAWEDWWENRTSRINQPRPLVT